MSWLWVRLPPKAPKGVVVYSTTVRVTITKYIPVTGFERLKRQLLYWLTKFEGPVDYKKSPEFDGWMFREGLRMKEAAQSVLKAMNYDAQKMHYGDDTAQTESYWLNDKKEDGSFLHIHLHCIPYAALEH